MSMTLLASGRRSKKPKKGMAVSLLLHGVVLALALTGTAHVAAQPDKPKEENLVYVAPKEAPPPPEPKKVYVAPKKKPAPAPKPKAPTPRPRVQAPKPPAPRPAVAPKPVAAAPRVTAPVSAPVLAPPTTVPVSIPKVDPTALPTVSDVVARAGDEIGKPTGEKTSQASESKGEGSGESKERVETESTGGIFNDSQVDVEVAMIGNLAPRYPEQLRSAGITGSVAVSFVVDANGRVEPGSINIVDSPHDAFSEAVKKALRSARYRPAQARGTKVRQLVEQRFSFRLDR